MSTRAVSTTWRFAVILSAALLVTAALAIPVGAQTFQDTFVGALDNNCSRLAGCPGTHAPTPTSPAGRTRRSRC